MNFDARTLVLICLMWRIPDHVRMQILLLPKRHIIPIYMEKKRFITMQRMYMNRLHLTGSLLNINPAQSSAQKTRKSSRITDSMQPERCGVSYTITTRDAFQLMVCVRRKHYSVMKRLTKTRYARLLTATSRNVKFSIALFFLTLRYWKLIMCMMIGGSCAG